MEEEMVDRWYSLQTYIICLNGTITARGKSLTPTKDLTEHTQAAS